MHSGMTARPETTRSARARRSVEDLRFVGAESLVNFDERDRRMRIKLGPWLCSCPPSFQKHTVCGENVHGLTKM